MFTAHSLSGNCLPPKTLCFTFDDGPGSNTLDIARFLYDEGIPATFFVVGKYAIHHPQILDTLIKWKHTVGNHTYDHPDLPYYVSVNGDIQDQVLRTEAILPSSKNDTIYFRAPYGKWSAEVSAELNSNLLSALNYVGPIHWDVGGVDCWYWQQGKTVEEAFEAYITDIEKAGKGIVVFHDEIADMDYLKPANKTLELLKRLVPKLKTMGYSFVSIDTIDSLKEAAANNLQFELSVSNGKLFLLSPAGNICLSKTGSTFSMQKIGNGQVVFLVDQQYIIVSDTYLVTTTPDRNAAATFDYIPVRNNRFMLRCTSGNYLTIDSKQMLSATAPFMRSAAIINYKPKNTNADTKLSLKEKLLLVKKGILFVKSKLIS
jgi:chitooligosaccharide deacetylase